MTVTYILSCDSIVVKVVKRKVTQPDEELRTIPPSPFVLEYTNEILCLLTSFLEGVLVGARGLRLLTYRFPTRI